MFTCTSCHRRAVRSLLLLLPDLHTVQAEVIWSSPNTASASTSLGSVRNHATVASIQKGHHIRLLRAAFKSKKEVPRSRREVVRGPTPPQRRNLLARAANKHLLDIVQEDDRNNFIAKCTSNTRLQADLRWTGGDALKLAKSVLEKLKAGDASQALEMVRLSEKLAGADKEKGVDSVVSWNHIMDYYMSTGATRAAFKVFNEMKKRGHKPDAHTYTIMLRGYTMNHKKPDAVEEAMKVYDSIWRPESNIKPSIIHSNAIINCLGRALNMDALWSVAGRLPDRGPGAADKWTYTTILNTMQACAVRDAQQLAETDGDQQAAANVIQNAIREGRRLWEDVVSRWRSGDVNIDQTLVSAMGRLLLLGQKHDWDDIFSLVEQTMRLPRLKVARRRRSGEEDAGWENALASPVSEEAPAASGLQQQLEVAVADEAAPTAKNEFAVVDLSDRPVRASGSGDLPSPYAHVGNNVLSLLIEASIKLRAIPTGKMYWDKLTNPDNQPFVMPDDDNLHAYLRLLRMSRSSKEMCELLRQPVNVALEGTWYRRKTFVIAMSTCARDFKNPNVFTYASTILDLMQTKLEKPDLKVMIMYLSLAVVTTPGVSAEIGGEFNAAPGGNNLIRAVERFNYSDLNYRTLLRQSGENQKDEGEDTLHVGRRSRKDALADRAERKKDKGLASLPEDLVEFLQALNSAYDKLLNHRLKMTEKMAMAFTVQKRELSYALQKLNAQKFPSSSREVDRKEAADALTDDDAALKPKRYPDRINGGADRKVKAPMMVDVAKRHPFLKEKRGRVGSQQPTPRAGSSPSSGGWANAWERSVKDMDKGEKSKGWVVV